MEADASQFETYRELSQPRLVSHSIGGGGSAGCPVGCGSMDKSLGGAFSEDSLSVEVTAEGFAGPFAYQVLSAESGDALDGWLTAEGFELEILLRPSIAILCMRRQLRRCHANP